MKKLLTLVFLLIGLVGFAQTNSHSGEIYGTVFTQNNCKLTRPYTEINVQVFEWDSVRNNMLIPISTSRYIVSWLPPTNGMWSYTIMITDSISKPLVVRMTPLGGTCVFNTYRPTFAPWSANHTRAVKIRFPQQQPNQPPPPPTRILQNVYLIPYIIEQPRIEPQD